MKLGEKIALCRKKAGLSQEELAARLNLSRQAVSRWETGAAAPDLEKVAELSKLFGVTTDYLLLEDREEPEPSSLPGEERRSEPAFDPVAERRRKFRIGFGVAHRRRRPGGRSVGPADSGSRPGPDAAVRGDPDGMVDGPRKVRHRPSKLARRPFGLRDRAVSNRRHSAATGIFPKGLR